MLYIIVKDRDMELPIIWSDCAHETMECFSFPSERVVSAGAFNLEWGNRVVCRKSILFEGLPFRKQKDQRRIKAMIERQ